jgi:hypothetical protein
MVQVNGKLRGAIRVAAAADKASIEAAALASGGALQVHGRQAGEEGRRRARPPGQYRRLRNRHARPVPSCYALILAAVVAGCGFQLRGRSPATCPTRRCTSRCRRTPTCASGCSATSRQPADEDRRRGPRMPRPSSSNCRTPESRPSSASMPRAASASTACNSLQVPRGQRQGPGTGRPQRDQPVARHHLRRLDVLAKDLEEGLLWRDMNNDLVNQIMRRLSIIKPKNPGLEEDD